MQSQILTSDLFWSFYIPPHVFTLICPSTFTLIIVISEPSGVLVSVHSLISLFIYFCLGFFGSLYLTFFCLSFLPTFSLVILFPLPHLYFSISLPSSLVLFFYHLYCSMCHSCCPLPHFILSYVAGPSDQDAQEEGEKCKHVKVWLAKRLKPPF